MSRRLPLPFFLDPSRRSNVKCVLQVSSALFGMGSPCTAQQYWTVSGLGKRGGVLWQICGSEYAIGPLPADPRARAPRRDSDARRPARALPSTLRRAPPTLATLARLAPAGGRSSRPHALRRGAPSP